MLMNCMDLIAPLIPKLSEEIENQVHDRGVSGQNLIWRCCFGDAKPCLCTETFYIKQISFISSNSTSSSRESERDKPSSARVFIFEQQIGCVLKIKRREKHTALTI
jgi:hypothetical protein